MTHSLNRVWIAALVLALAGCDQLGIETPEKESLRLAAEAKAIGSACRHAVRAIEDCYTLNPKADKAAMFEGWREMDEYMRENKLEGVTPVVPRPPLGKGKSGRPKDSEASSSEEEEIIEDAPSPKKAKASE